MLYAAPPQYHIRGAAINVVLRRRFGRSFSGQVNGTYEGANYQVDYGNVLTAMNG